MWTTARTYPCGRSCRKLRSGSCLAWWEYRFSSTHCFGTLWFWASIAHEEFGDSLSVKPPSGSALVAAAEQFIQAEAASRLGLDHGVGHSLLLLYDVKAPIDQKNNEFNGLGHYPSNTSLSTF